MIRVLQTSCLRCELAEWRCREIEPSRGCERRVMIKQTNLYSIYS